VLKDGNEDSAIAAIAGLSCRQKDNASQVSLAGKEKWPRLAGA